MIYRNLGSETTIGDKPTLKRLGQPIELDESLAAEAIEGGALLLTENEFASLSFTDDELKKYATVGAQSRAPEGVAAKLKAGRDKVHEKREAIAGKKVDAANQIIADRLAADKAATTFQELQEGVKPLLAAEHNQIELKRLEGDNA